MADAPQGSSTEVLYRGLERVGLAPLLLVALSYFVYRDLLHPLAESYRKLVDTTAENSQLIREEIQKGNQVDAERVLFFKARGEETQAILTENRQAIKGIDAKLDQILGKLP